MNTFTPSQWLRAIAGPGSARHAISEQYGFSRIDERLSLLRRVVETFAAHFGDLPIRVFRCPARLNLRGMHVDTHGGFLNLMTHQREVVVVSAPSGDASSAIVNVDKRFPGIQLDPAAMRNRATFRQPWRVFIRQDNIAAHVGLRRGSWANYLEGSILRAQHDTLAADQRGIHAAVGSDIPYGASLSSSTALSLAVFMSICAWNNKAVATDALVAIAQDIEWYTGARIGTSDQSGMLLPRANEVVNFAPSSPVEVRRASFPADLRVLVIDSHTERNISGAHQIDYTRNRFAYSLALEILRQKMAAGGVPTDRLGQYTRLSDFAIPNLGPLGGVRALYAWLACVPESLTLTELRSRYALPLLEETYDRYFGSLPEGERPVTFAIRGPLLFGLAESERARLFIDALLQGDHEVTGYYMTLGHDGDRRFDAMGFPWASDVGGDAIRLLGLRETHIARVPGAYGASSRPLDALVDRAISEGALGASLTGAGIAGAVIALVESAYADRIADGIRAYIAGAEYRALAPNAADLSSDEFERSVIINESPNSAGEIMLAS